MIWSITFGILIGCTSQTTSSKNTSQTEQQVAVDETLLQSSWPVRMADPKNRQPFEGDDGWSAYFQREYLQALPYMNGTAKARVHLELSELYHQSAVMHSHSILHLYGKKETTPLVECLYLRGVAHAILGEHAKAKSLFAEYEKGVATIPEDRKEVAGQLLKKGQAWLAFLDKKASLPSQLFFVDEENLRQGSPIIDPIEPYFFYGPSLLEPQAPPIEIGMSEGTSLFILSNWHREQAQKILESDTNAMQIQQVLQESWNSNSSGNLEGEFSAKVGDEWLFLGFFLMESDIAYMYELLQIGKSAKIDEQTYGTSGQKIKDISKKWSSKSILASQIELAIQEIAIPNDLGGLEKHPRAGEKVLALRPDIILELAGQLKDVSLSQMKKQQGKGDPVFIKFAEFSEIALLRMGVIVAEVNGQYRDSGVLRLSVNDISQEATRDPLFQIAFGSWDVGNRFTMRAQDTLHRYSQSFPSLENSRKPVDLLSIRIGRDSTGGGVAN